MDTFERIADKKGIKKICAFLESPWFSILFGVAVFLFYVLNIPVVTMGVFAVCGIFICLFCEDTRAGLTLVLMLMISFRYADNPSAYTSTFAIILYCVAGPCVFLAALYRITKRKVPFKSRFGLLGVGLFASAILLGGVFTKYYTAFGFLQASGLAAAVFFFYLFFAYTLKNREGNLLYLARVLAVCVCVISLEIVEFYLCNYKWGTPLDSSWKGRIRLGWAISNMVAEMIAFCLPAVFYLIYKEKRGYCYWFVVAFSLFAIYFTFARNALLGAAICVAVGAAINCVRGEHKSLNRALVLLFALFLFILCVVLYAMGYADNLLRFFLDVGFSDRGRFDIWKKYFKFFKERPVFGVGFNVYDAEWRVDYNAHNTLVQMLGSTGAVGMAMYLFHRAQTLGMLLKKPTLDRFFVGGCIMISLLMGMFSSTFFHFYAMVYYSVVLLVVQKSGNKR